MIIRKIYWYLLTLVTSPFYGKIGKQSYIARPSYLLGKRKLFIDDRVRILYGFRCEIYLNGKVLIGKNCSIGHNLHISACETLEIGSDTTISSNVFLGSLSHTFNDPYSSTMAQPFICKKTHIGRNCFIGTGVVILPGTILGENCIVGANSVLKGRYNDCSIIAGAPGKIIKSLNTATKTWDKVAKQ
jgi:acetyltransferase-like isoleucine patch superfamily enzyme